MSSRHAKYPKQLSEISFGGHLISRISGEGSLEAKAAVSVVPNALARHVLVWELELVLQEGTDAELEFEPRYLSKVMSEEQS